MTDLRWYEVFPPHERALGDVTAMLRVLAGRARQGIWRTTPIVVFECWIRPHNVRWLIGMDQRLASALPAQLMAQMPGLTLAELPEPHRPLPRAAMTVRGVGLSYLLKLDNAVAVTTGCLH